MARCRRPGRRAATDCRPRPRQGVRAWDSRARGESGVRAATRRPARVAPARWCGPNSSSRATAVAPLRRPARHDHTAMGPCTRLEDGDAPFVSPVHVVDEEHGIAGHRDHTVGDLVVRAAQCLAQCPLERQVGTSCQRPECAAFEMRNPGEGEPQQRSLSDACAPDDRRQTGARDRVSERRRVRRHDRRGASRLHHCRLLPPPKCPTTVHQRWRAGNAA